MHAPFLVLFAVLALGGDGPPVVRSDANGVELLLTSTPQYAADLTLGNDLRLRSLRMEGAGVLLKPGRVGVPMRRFLVEVPPGVDVRVEAWAEGVASEYVGPLDAAPGTESGSFEPGKWVELEYVGFLRERRVACLRWTPVSYEPASGIAHRATRLRVVLAFAQAGTVAAPAPLRSALGSAVRPSAPIWDLEVTVRERGLHRVLPVNLFQAGIDPTTVDPRFLGMSHGGKEVAILVDGEADGSFDPGDRILFWADPVRTVYASVDAYRLFEAPHHLAGELGVERMATVDGTPSPGAVPEAWFRDAARAETNALYWQVMPNGKGKDHWFWKKTLAPSTESYTVALESPLAGSGSIRARTALHGYTDTLQDPDHHTRLHLNGVLVEDATWDGTVPFLHDAAATAGLVQPGDNTVRIEQVADTGAAVDGVYSDWVEIEYDRAFVAHGDELHFSYEAQHAVTLAVSGLTFPQVHALVVTDADRPVRVLGSSVQGAGGDFEATFDHDPDGTSEYGVTGEPGLHAPLAVTPRTPFPAPGKGADLVVLAPSSLRAAIDPLVRHRRAQGLRVRVVQPGQAYDHFGHGTLDPWAIRAFLKWAFESWPAPPPSHVLLVGEGSYDFHDHLGIGVPNSAPPYLYESWLSGEIPTDHLYATLAGSDPLPDVFVGRIPGDSPAEVATVVDKILTYETAPPPGSWTSEVVHVADNGASFTTLLDDLAAGHVPPGYTVTPVYADAYASQASAHSAIVAELSAGCSLATYLGHGGTTNWGAELLWNSQLGSLTNDDRLPLVSMLNCLNGYFASPLSPHCLAEGFLLKAGGGAVACFAPSGTGFTSELAPVAELLYDRLFAGETFGGASTGAKLDAYVQHGAIEENLWSLVFFGDPAGRLRQ